MTMANTENTREKKTMRKRARPLRGCIGTVTGSKREARQTRSLPTGKDHLHAVQSLPFLRASLESQGSGAPFPEGSISI